MAHEKFLELAYGENPHQKAALYVEVGARTHVLAKVAKRHGRQFRGGKFHGVLGARGRGGGNAATEPRSACGATWRNSLRAPDSSASKCDQEM